MKGVLVPCEALREFVQRILTGAGVAEHRACLVADCLITGNLRGVDSHGVQLLLFYMNQLEDGRVNPDAEGHIASELGSILVYDGENGLGQVIAAACTDHAVRLAAEHGIGMVVARESNHIGPLAWSAQRISQHGCLALVFSNASPIVAPFQGREARWGTNPICVSVPDPDGKGWLLDMATTTVALGKIYKANILGQTEIPEGWAFDPQGNPTTSVQAALKGSLMPLGGYKGSGLAMMVEILTGILGGGPFSVDLGGFRHTGKPFRASQTFIAIEIERFMPIDEFTARIRRLVEIVHTTPTAPGYEEVLVAGDPEWRAEDERRRDGIPLPTEHWQKLCAIAGRHGVSIPDVRPLLES